MRVLTTFTSYPTEPDDWRGRFIYDLVANLSEHPDVDLRAWGPPGPMPLETSYIASSSEAAWLSKLMSGGGIAHQLRNSPLSGLLLGLRLSAMLGRVYRRNRDVDVVHVNWASNAIPLLGTRLPAVISVLGTDFRLLRSAIVRTATRAALRGRTALIAPNAQWMVPELHSWFGNNARIRSIPFGIDSRWYEIARTKTDHHARRWLAVIRVTEKKIGPLFRWGQQYFDSGNELHLIGPMQESISIPDWVHFHGPASPDQLATDWFPDAHALISLSEHDEGRPQVLLEAMAAGIPVVASDIPAHADIIEDGNTGLLVRSQVDLRNAIETLSNPDTARRIGHAAQVYVQQNFGTWRDCAQRYVEAYREVLQ